jgi:outer membrane lipoprotein SlyB
MSALNITKMPIVIIASVALLIFSLVGIGTMTGLIPGVFSQSKTCNDCGVVESISAFQVQGQATGLGAVTGGVVGAVVGSTIGEGKGKTLAEVAGAAGGAYAGHQIEKNARKTIRYRISVRMNDDTIRTVTQADDNGLSAGDSVKILNGTVVRS